MAHILIRSHSGFLLSCIDIEDAVFVHKSSNLHFEILFICKIKINKHNPDNLSRYRSPNTRLRSSVSSSFLVLTTTDLFFLLLLLLIGSRAYKYCGQNL